MATTRRRHKGKVYEAHLLRRTYREGGKVKHETLGNLSHLPHEILELVRAALAGEMYLPASAHLEVMRSLPHGHVAAVVGTLRKIGQETTIGTRDPATWSWRWWQRGC